MVRNAGAQKMETTFYDDHSFHQRFSGDSVNNLKRSMTLDLNSNNGPVIKKMKLIPVSAAPMLTSPDCNKLNLRTPEIEKILMAQSGLATPTPSLIFPPKAPTEAQEMFSRGFEDALSVLQHNSDSSQGPVHHVELPRSSSSSSSSGATYVTLDSQFPSNIQHHNHFGLGLSADSITVKEEPQTVPLGPTPPLSPIDMECQERYKLERKRERNRVAASKCRRRKLERIARLEDKVKQLKGENTDLSSVVNRLKEQVCLLKEQVMEHMQSGCQILQPSANFMNSC